MSRVCSICALPLDQLVTGSTDSEKIWTEKAPVSARTYSCCGRLVCLSCSFAQPQFNSYCPFCQNTGGLRTSTEHSNQIIDDKVIGHPEKGVTTVEKSPDVLHFVDPAKDTIGILAVKYDVPASCLRKSNGIFSDHLLSARRTIIIPGEFYTGGVSLSPQPVDGEELDSRKQKIRRWMVQCKVPDYDIATIYLGQADYNLDAAIQAYRADEIWERDHPLDKRKCRS